MAITLKNKKIKKSKKRRILFLDIDGVLNNDRFWLVHAIFDIEKFAEMPHSNPDIELLTNAIDKRALELLLFALREVEDLEIVISSNWAIRFKMGTVVKVLSALGLEESRIAGATPRKFSGTTREHEISMWIEQNDRPCLNDYAVLDDLSLDFSSESRCAVGRVGYLLSDRFIQTDPLNGFTYKDAISLIRLFKPCWNLES